MFVVLVVVKEEILPEPLAARPIAVLLLVQLYTVLVTNDPPNVTVDVPAPTQIVWLVGLVTVGTGLMVIVNVFAVPAQVKPPFVYFGVTVIKPEIAALVVLVVTKEAIFPLPEPTRPIAVLLFVQS